jgi:amidase
MAEAIRRKEVSSEELVREHLRRIEEVNPKLNAVVQVRTEAALREAREADQALARGEVRGPLHGVPFTIKEAWETEGMIWSGGTLGRAQYRGSVDSTVVARVRAAGGIALGATNLPELSLAFEADNLVYGRTNNPYDLSRTPGGSGGGGAAIIAVGGSPLEIGADAGGSIRLPCHFSGIAGLRPSTGRVPLTGYFPPPLGVFPLVTAAGPMARKVEDLRLVLPIVAGPDWRDPDVVPAPLGNAHAVVLKKLRAAFHTDNGVVAPTPETVEVVRSAARALNDAGAVVDDARPAGIEQCLEIFLGLFSADGGAGIRMLLKTSETTRVHPLTEALLRQLEAHSLSSAQFGELLARRDVYRSAMLSFLEKYDVILCPACAVPAIPHGTCWNSDTMPAFSYTMAHNLTGWPGAVVRCGTSPEGLPIGVQIVARPWREDVALAVAEHLETVMGGWKRPPDI